MKRLLAALLAVVMLCTMAVAMVSCGASIEKMGEKCKALKEDGEIAAYTATEKTVYAYTEDGKIFSAQEFDDKDAAVAAYDAAKTSLDALEAAGTDVSEYVLKRKGNIVIMSTSKDLYKKIA